MQAMTDGQSPDPQPPTGFLTLQEAARRVGVSGNEVLAAAVQGAFVGALRLPGKVWFIPEEALRSWQGERA